MKKLLVLALGLLLVLDTFAWGQKGHDVTACIAERYLTRKAARQVRRVLNGSSAVYVSNWMDNASHTPQYAHTKTWHYFNIAPDGALETTERLPEGDVLRAVTELTAQLKSGRLDSGEEETALRMLIHLVGDMHCPMHLGHAEDLGGNLCKVRFFGRDTNLHSVWDTDLVEAAHRWSYTEWAAQLDNGLSKADCGQIASGTPEEWVRETHALCRRIYADTPGGTAISYDYISEYAPLVERQFLRGGLRLARLLNEIYGGR